MQVMALGSHFTSRKARNLHRDQVTWIRWLHDYKFKTIKTWFFTNFTGGSWTPMGNTEHPWVILKGKKPFTIFSEWKLILSENRWNKNKDTTQKIVTHNPLRLDYVSKEQKRVAIYIFWKRP